MRVLTRGDPSRWAGSGREATPVPDLAVALREVAGGAARHAVLVLDPGAWPTRSVAAEWAAALADPGIAGVSWLALVSDGIDVLGRRHDMGTYVDEAPLVGRRAPRAVAAGSPAVAILNADALRALDFGDVTHFGGLVEAGWGGGFGSYISSHVRFAFNGPRSQRAPAEDAPELADSVWRERLRRVRSEPSVTVGIRTALKRPGMLARAVQSAAGAPILLAGAVPGPDLAAEADRLRGLVPGLEIATRTFDPGEVPVRAAGIATIVESAATDYVWLLDDDDYLEPGALESLALAVPSGARPLVVGSSNRWHEDWDGERLHTAAAGEPFEAGMWFNAFSGWNSLPVCSVVYPRESLRARLAHNPLRHDLGEDYALFLLALTDPGQDVVVVPRPIANVSIRAGGDNVVTDSDRGRWMVHTASFLSDITRDELAGAALPWLVGEGLGAAPGPVPAPAPTQVWWKRWLWTMVPDRLHPAVRRLRGRR